MQKTPMSGRPVSKSTNHPVEHLEIPDPWTSPPIFIAGLFLLLASLSIIVGGCRPAAEASRASIVSNQTPPQGLVEEATPSTTRPSTTSDVDPSSSKATQARPETASAGSPPVDATDQAPAVAKPAAPPAAPADGRASSPHPEEGVELLQNSGCEEKSAAGIPSWVCMSGDWRAAPSGFEGVPSSENNAHFLPGTPGLEFDELRQDFPVAGLAQDIDEGKLAFRLIGHVRSQAGTQPGTSRIVMEFLDEAKTNVLDRAGTKPLASVGSWTPQVLVKNAPVKTRWVRVRLISHAPADNARPGLFDGLSLKSRAAGVVGVADGAVEGLPDWPVPGSGDELLKNPSGEGKAVEGLIRSWTSMGGDWVPWDKDARPLEGLTFFCSGAMKVDELQQDVPVVNLQSEIDRGKQGFKFVGHVRSQPGAGPASARVVVEFLNGSKTKVLGRVLSDKTASVGGWKPVVLAGLAPGRTRWVRVRLISYRGSDDAGRALFDDLSLKASPAAEGAVPVGLEEVRDLPDWPVADPDGEELLWNPGCEEPFINDQISGWMHTTGWQPLGASPHPFEGSFSFQPGQSAFAKMIQPINISHLSQEIDAGKQKFRFVGRVRSNPGGNGSPGTARVFIEFVGSGKPLKNNQFWSEEVTSIDGWEPIRLPEMLAPKGARGIRVHLISRRPRPDSTCGLFDGLSLMAVDSESGQDSGDDDIEVPRQLPEEGSAEARLNKLGLRLTGSRLVTDGEIAFLQGAKKIRPFVQKMRVASQICENILYGEWVVANAENELKGRDAQIAAVTEDRRPITRGAKATSDDNQRYAALTIQIEALKVDRQNFATLVEGFRAQAMTEAVKRQYANDFRTKCLEFLEKLGDLKPSAEAVRTEYRKLNNNKDVKAALLELRKSRKVAGLKPSKGFDNAARMIENTRRVAKFETGQSP